MSGPTAPPDPDGPEPPLDRTISPIAGRLAAGPRGRIVAFAGLLAGCAVFVLATWSADRPRPAKAPTHAARQVVAFEPAAPPPTLARPGADPPRLTGDDGLIVPALEPGPAAPSPEPGMGRSPAPATRPAASLMAYSRDVARSEPGDADGSPAVPARAPVASTELNQLRRGSSLGRVRARHLGDRNFLILAGAAIPCVLQTALDSTASGYASCLIGADVYSDNGAVVLLDKGTRVLGEYRGGLAQGRRRLFVLWTRAVTPTGVAIDLASPASDALGRGGFDGAVDTHFWDRFGAALLLSLVDDGAHALAGRDARSATARLPSDAAGLAVQGGADIPPTLRKPQGAEVTIFAAQDFDFSGVYGLRARAP